MVAMVLHPPSTMGSEIPVEVMMAWAAGVMLSFIKDMRRFMPVNATPSVMPDEIASFIFIPTIILPAIIIIGTNMGAPNPKKKLTTFVNTCILSPPSPYQLLLTASMSFFSSSSCLTPVRNAIPLITGTGYSFTVFVMVI